MAVRSVYFASTVFRLVCVGKFIVSFVVPTLNVCLEQIARTV